MAGKSYRLRYAADSSKVHAMPSDRPPGGRVGL